MTWFRTRFRGKYNFNEHENYFKRIISLFTFNIDTAISKQYECEHSTVSFLKTMKKGKMLLFRVSVDQLSSNFAKKF